MASETGIEIEIEYQLAYDEDALVHDWRVEQLVKLGISKIVPQAAATLVDWHELARLVDRGCSPALALEIVR